MLRFIFAVTSACMALGAVAQTPYVDEIIAWRAKAETSLKRDTGWLTLAGRWELKSGVNTLGTAPGSDIVFPAGLTPERLGEVLVEGTRATLKLAPGITMRTEREGGEEFSERVMDADPEKMKWVHRGRLALTTFKHPAGKMILRIADQENSVRTGFAGRTWYDVKPAMKLDAKFVPAVAGSKRKIVNVLGEITDETLAGTVEFRLGNAMVKLEALGDENDKDLFIIFNDATAATDGKGTYPAGRFLVVNRPTGTGHKASTATVIDFNRAYNPPCAFSAFTSCPLPPDQNKLKVRVEAGEKYRG